MNMQTKDVFYYDCWQDEDRLFHAVISKKENKIKFYTTDLQECFSALYYFRQQLKQKELKL